MGNHSLPILWNIKSISRSFYSVYNSLNIDSDNAGLSAVITLCSTGKVGGDSLACMSFTSLASRLFFAFNNSNFSIVAYRMSAP